MDFQIGQKVLVKSLKKPGTLLSLTSSKVALVNVGKLELKVPLADLEIITNAHKSQKEKVSAKKFKPKKNLPGAPRQKSLKIDYHGFTKATCIADFERRLNQAYLEQVKEIIVVHGRGQGILKSALIQYLESLDLKLSFRSSAINENELIINL